MASAPASMKEFPPFRLDTINQCLWRNMEIAADERVMLTPKAFDILRYLVENAGRLVSHDEFLETLWPETHVQPEVLKSHVSEIRAALGDDSKKPIFIETLPRRGYRFIAKVSRGSLAGPAPSARLRPGRLVGRERTLRELCDCFKKMQRGERQVVFITGEPGIGKTALLDAFTRLVAAETPEARLAFGQCIEGYGSKEAYYPMLEAIAGLCHGDGGETVVQVLAAQAPTWLVQLPALLTPDGGATLQREILGATRERMLREIGDAVEAIASRGPLVILFEDLQWVDSSTVDLISVLARRRAPATLMVLATFRDGDVALPDHPLRQLTQDLRSRQLCRELAVEPLDEAAVAEYLAAEQPGSPLPNGLAPLLYRHSDGNPLFLITALDHITSRKLVVRHGRGWQLEAPLETIDLAVPESLRALIQAQIERLTPEEQRVLEIASLTQSRSFSVVARASAAMDAEPDRFEDVCERLSRRTRILRPAVLAELPDGTVSPFYEFTHELYREVLYNRIAPGRRARLHRQAAEWAEERFSERLNEAAPFMAHHFEHGFDWTRAVRYLRIAADTAGRRYAPREATALLQHALELSAKLQDTERATTETGILDQLAAMYVVSFDARAVETYGTLAERAASYGLLDLEVKALIDMAYPLSWIDGERCLEVVDRALRLSAAQSDPLKRARTRASALVRRIWAGGWNQQAADDCRRALEEIRRAGDGVLVAAHLIDSNFIRWSSSEYRAAHQEAVESLAVLADGRTDNQYLSFAHWLSQFTLPWSLLFLGEWGEGLRVLAAEIALADKNGDRYRAQTLQLYRAWIHLHAMDFAGVLGICHAALPSLDDPARRPWRRFCLALAGSADVASGRYDAAADHLLTARDEMDGRPVINDWYCRMMLEQALTELWLAKGDLSHARAESERFLEVTLATAERTWQALAWDASARVAIAEHDLHRARSSIAHALSAIEGVEVPLADWRVHGTAAALSRRTGANADAGQHRALARATILQLANSLPEDEPLRAVFFAAPSVSSILGKTTRTTKPTPRS